MISSDSCNHAFSPYHTDEGDAKSSFADFEEIDAQVEEGSKKLKKAEIHAQLVIDKLKMPIEEYQYLKNLASFVLHKNTNTPQALQWRHVLYETVLHIIEEEGQTSLDPEDPCHVRGIELDGETNSSPLSDSEYVAAIFEKLSTCLLDLFSCLLCPLTKDGALGTSLKRRKSKWLNNREPLKEHCLPTHIRKKTRGKRTNETLEGIADPPRGIELFTDQEILTCAEEANWPPSIIQRVRDRLNSEWTKVGKGRNKRCTN